MALTNSAFKGRKAPCGQLVDGDAYEDRDDEAALTQGLDYACGCRTVQHEYHDGSVSRKVIRHDGIVLVDEPLSHE